jgi:class 3 adenylate cyclase
MDVVTRLRETPSIALTELMAMWDARPAGGWSEGPEVYRRLAERVLKSGEPLLGHDILGEGLERWRDDVRLRQLQGLALARSGATARANGVLVGLQQEGHGDAETLGLLARTYKDLSGQAADPAERTRLLGLAGGWYERAYVAANTTPTPEETRAWTGINAASTSLLLGRRDRAEGFAREVREFGVADLKRALDGAGDPYWFFATLGEAALLLGEWEVAEHWYGQASDFLGGVRGRFADLSTTRRQARLLLEHLGQDRHRLDGSFRVPRVVTFAGHMIDRPDRTTPRFPPALEAAVSRLIVDKLEALGAGFGYASAACGGDILFHEAMLERQGEAHLVLPYAADEFARTSVDVAPGWRARFQWLLERATRVVTATDQRSPGPPITYDYGNMLLEGMAATRAEQLETQLSLVVLWDGRAGDGPGGTASVVERWRGLGHDVHILGLPGSPAVTPAIRVQTAGRPVAAAGIPRRVSTGSARGGADEFSKHIMAMLFADAVGFSRLTEEQVPVFVRDFLGAVAEVLAGSPGGPALKNTWGDGLYFVFHDIERAGNFALDLRDRIAGERWVGRGLPEDLSLRIALHAGPVYQCLDPVSGHTNYIGSHVSRAARIEPITPPGQVYASQPFVAIAAARNARSFAWDYVGQVPLAKKYGSAPMYHLRRRG